MVDTDWKARAEAAEARLAALTSSVEKARSTLSDAHTSDAILRISWALAALSQAAPVGDGAGTLAASLLRKIRAGELDPRPAAQALGLPYDQDAITSILEQASLCRSPSEGEREKIALDASWTDPEFRAKWAKDPDHKTFLEMLQALRCDEGDSVTLLCDNPEGPPNNVVECCGGWTGWTDRRFSGETLEAALRTAYVAKLAILFREQESGR